MNAVHIGTREFLFTSLILFLTYPFLYTVSVNEEETKTDSTTEEASEQSLRELFKIVEERKMMEHLHLSDLIRARGK